MRLIARTWLVQRRLRCPRQRLLASKASAVPTVPSPHQTAATLACAPRRDGRTSRRVPAWRALHGWRSPKTARPSVPTQQVMGSTFAFARLTGKKIQSIAPNWNVHNFLGQGAQGAQGVLGVPGVRCDLTLAREADAAPVSATLQQMAATHAFARPPGS
mmetsp:Transcript_106688/g.130103  ORF Transcript_106688/g.130103 Transcript_106688/m.130103 type:complete len:159 (+) Transcript_106688:492-968(+)